MMIIRESEDIFTMTAQHDHAILSGKIAKHFKPEYSMGRTYWKEALLAITEHDRGWIGLDEMPIWHDRMNAPFSFMDYPLSPKLSMYAKGISEVEEMNKYAGLLCSLHYTSFEPVRNSKHAGCIEFMEQETRRQVRLREELDHPDPKTVTRHFKLLQLCDIVSLYVCLNKEGASKDEEHPWYKEGFGTRIGRQSFSAQWLSRTEIQIVPFPFEHHFEVTLRMKHVPKDLRSRIGIEAAYKETAFTEQSVSFVS